MAEKRDRRPVWGLLTVLAAALAGVAAVSVRGCDEVTYAPPRAPDSPHQTAAETAAARLVQRVPEPRERIRVESPADGSAARPARLTILVTDGGAPVPGARVSVLPETAIRSRRAPDLQPPAEAVASGVTDADGTLVVRHAYYGWVRVVAVSGARVGAARLRLWQDGAPSVEVRLTDGLRVRGLVLSTTDRPIRRAQVTLALVGPLIPMGNRFGVGWTATTDAEGRFDLGFLPAAAGDEGYVLRVRGNGCEDLDSEASPSSLREDPMVLRVTGRVRLRGTVRRNDGRPAVSARLTLGGKHMYAYENGEFALAAVPDEGGVLHVLGRASRARRIDVGPFTAATNDLGEIVVGVSSVISGRVVDDRGEPVVEAVVQCTADGAERRVTTDAQGRFELYDVSALPHVLQVRPTDERLRHLGQVILPDVAPGTQDVEVMLTPAE